MDEVDERFRASARRVEELERHVGMTAQAIHQAYHQDMPMGWKTCPRDICRSAQYALEPLP